MQAILNNGFAVCMRLERADGAFQVVFHEIVPIQPNGQLSCGSPRLVALGIFGTLTKLKSAANDLPYTSQVALGLFGQCNAQASKVAHSRESCPCMLINTDQSNQINVLFNVCSQEDDNRPVHKLV